MGLGNYTLCNQTWGCGNGIRPACYAGDAERRLRVRVPLPTPYAPVAQLVERRIEVPRVRGSSPLWGAKRRIGRAGRLRRFRKPLSPQGLQRFKSSILRHMQRCANGTRPGWSPGGAARPLGVQVLLAAPEYKRFEKRSGRQTERDRRLRTRSGDNRIPVRYAPIAQMDRAPDYGSGTT